MYTDQYFHQALLQCAEIYVKVQRNTQKLNDMHMNLQKETSDKKYYLNVHSSESAHIAVLHFTVLHTAWI